MPNYRYQALNGQGVAVRGKLTGQSEQDVLKQLRDKGLYPQKLSRERIAWKTKSSDREVELFFDDLSGLIEAGATLDAALNLMAKQKALGALAGVAEDLAGAVREGKSLSEALTSHDGLISPPVVSMVAAGESCGRMAETLREVGASLRWKRELKSEMVSALSYPLILLVLCFVSILIMLVHILPQFAQVFIDMGRELPQGLGLMLGIGDWLGSWGWILPLVLGFGWLAARRMARYRIFSLAVSRILMRLPMLGDMLMKAELGRYFKTFGQLASGGVPLMEAARLAGETLAGPVVRQMLSKLPEAIRTGRSVSSYFSMAGDFPDRVETLLAFSEEQGRLPAGMIRLGSALEQEFRQKMRWVMRFFEPVVILGTGGVIGGTVLCMFSAISELTDFQF